MSADMLPPAPPTTPPDAHYEPTLVVPAPGESPAATSAGNGTAPAASLAGYHLVSLIGSGGYGEVWRAIGPGGLPKAVKILHGRFDGREADTELRSLQRIRELRHPFLLSVERIEVVNGKLMIVTELTDQNLEDVCQELQRQGNRGIPRGTLLEYLHDVADALDFLGQQHGLQHLDVKPANLLLQGNHVKVADFGLIKDIKTSNVSMVGGFTPLYAPPELFSGRPSETSDQYSLAIVYQVLLTGTPPFAGRTAAQLMSQHLSSPPDLAPLTPGDRPAVARALSKNPRARFQNCRQFIESLAQRKAPRLRVNESLLQAAEHGEPVFAGPSGEHNSATFRLPVTDLSTAPLEPLDIQGTEARYRPTLFLGLGGMAGRVLLTLRRRLGERFGVENDLAALPMLLLDTDAKAIAALREIPDGYNLKERETLAIPLRDPQYYRSDERRSLLEWLSRRWLFNIPRSRQVEGIRPLGRLAFSDHYDAIRRNVRDALKRATDDASLAATRTALGLPMTSALPRVYLVSSINGGTGSGAVLDMGYLILSLAAELGLQLDGVTALLLHATCSHDQRGDIQAANAVSCLQELRHLNTPGLGYPGDSALRLSAIDRGPFEHTYVAHLGEALSDADYRKQLDHVAEYLFRSTVTPAVAFFDACRRRPTTAVGMSETPTLRTFAAAMAQTRARQQVEAEARALCCGVVRRWQGLAPRGEALRPGRKPEAVLPEEFPATIEQWAGKVAALLRGEVSKKAEAHFRATWEAAMKRNAESAGTCVLPVRDVDQEFALEGRDRPTAVVWLVGKELAPVSRSVNATVRSGVLALVDHPEFRMPGAREALQQTNQRLDEAAGLLPLLIREMDKDLELLRRQLLPPRERTAEPAFRKFNKQEAAVYFEYCTIRLYQCVYHCFLGFIEDIRATTKQLGAELASLGWQLQEFHEHLAQAKDNPLQVAAPADDQLMVVEQHLAASQRVHPSSLMLHDEEALGRLESALRDETVRFLIHSPGNAEAPSTPTAAASADGQALEDAAQPILQNVGGGRRVLGMLRDSQSQGEWRQRLEAAFGKCVTLHADPQSATFLCTEVQGLTVEAIVNEISAGKPQVVDMAGRIHTRCDIHW